MTNGNRRALAGKAHEKGAASRQRQSSTGFCDRLAHLVTTTIIATVLANICATAPNSDT